MSIAEYRSEPCPICGHKDWCGRREDGLILCKRPPSPPEVAGYVYKGLGKDGRTGLYVEAGHDRTPARAIPPPQRKAPCRPGPSLETIQKAHAEAVSALTPERRSALAHELGLPESALAELAIGWSDTARHHADPDVKGAWVLPECDGQGRMIGATFRFPRESVAGLTDPDGKPIGNKSGGKDLRRGLTLPADWKEMPEPVLVVEGGSDVVAGRAVGLSVIGRPSNSGGAELLAQACRRRRVILLGENDRKSDGRWPGKEGADSVARRLEALWGRPVPVALPPEGTKDLREWIGKRAPNPAEDELKAVCRQIVEAVQPPAILLLAEPPRRRGGRPTVKAFRWADGADADPIHSDRLAIADAASRRRYAGAVAAIEPTCDGENLQRRLLALKVGDRRPSRQPPADGPPHATAHQQMSVESSPREDGVEAPDGPLPSVLLPGGSVPIHSSAARLGALLAATGRHFVRGGAMVKVERDAEGLPALRPVKPAGLASLLESVARLQELQKVDGEVVPVPTTCSEQTAKLILHAEAFLHALPPIDILTRCPVLIERDGELVQVCGYDRESAIMAAGEPAAEMSLEEARELLSGVLQDFRFATEADRSRALAAVITPALVFGGLLRGRAPVDLGEADASQTGKGYRNRLTAAVYRHAVKTITQRNRGVGSMEESFNTALMRGSNFIALDNIRGKVDCPAIESFLTEDSYMARAPYQPGMEIDPRRVVVQMTSNRADITVDLANRCSCVNLYRQPGGYRFRRYGEGDVLGHIRANQPAYLGAVFAVIKAWHAAGKPTTDESRHDFRPWVQTLDWIVRNLLGAAPLMDGHRQTQIRMTRPGLNWLRDVAFAVRREGLMGRELRTRDLVEIIVEDGGIELPGLTDGQDLADDEVRKQVLQATGRRLARCFKAGDTVILEGLRVVRQVITDTTQWKDSKVYRILAAEGVQTDPPMRDPERDAIGGSLGGSAADSRLTAYTACRSEHPLLADDSSPAYAPAYAPPMDPPIKTQYPPNPPEGSLTSMYGNDVERGANNNAPILTYSSSAPGGIGGTGGREGREAQLDPDDEGLLI